MVEFIETIMNNILNVIFKKLDHQVVGIEVFDMGVIDSFFQISMVTTYTYDPLIGITSATDPRGYTTYYDYDGFGRLNQVKDADGHILSANEYNYKQ